jgi:WD40 repeat protein
MTVSTYSPPGGVAGNAADVSPIVALSPDGRLLATVGSDRFLRMWEVSTGAQVWALAQGPPFRVDAFHPSFSPDGTRLLMCPWPAPPRLVDVATGETMVSPGDGPGCALPFSADGFRIAFALFRAGSDRVEVWDLRQPTRVAAAPYAEISSGGSFAGVGALSPDGSVFAVAGGLVQNVVLLWDADTLAPLDTLEHRVRVFQVAYSMDGTRILTSSDDGAVRIWNAQTGRLIFTSPDEPSDLLGAVFSQDGSRIAVFYSDGRILVQAITFGDVLEIAKGRVTRSLTDTECREYLHVPSCPTV